MNILMMIRGEVASSKMVPRDPSVRRDEVRQLVRDGNPATHVTDVTLFGMCQIASPIAVILKLEPTLTLFADALVSSIILIECPPLPLKCLLG